MKTFSKFIFEMAVLKETPWLDTSLTKDEFTDGGHSLNKNMNLNKHKLVSTIPETGHKVYQHMDGHEFFALNPETNKADMIIQGHYHSPSREFSVDMLEGRPGSKLKAHEFYSHLITKHKLTLKSSSQQSEGGMKVWQRLQDKHGDKVQMTMQDYSNKIHKMNTKRWKDNYSSDFDHPKSNTRFVAKPKDE